jgi:hypothetical protein
LDETDYVLEKAFDCIEDCIKEHTKWANHPGNLFAI